MEKIIKTRTGVLAGPKGSKHATGPRLSFGRAKNLIIIKLLFPSYQNGRKE
jgi:hypothetical protein